MPMTTEPCRRKGWFYIGDVGDVRYGGMWIRDRHGDDAIIIEVTGADDFDQDAHTITTGYFSAGDVSLGTWRQIKRLSGFTMKDIREAGRKHRRTWLIEAAVCYGVVDWYYEYVTAVSNDLQDCRNIRRAVRAIMRRNS